MLLPQNQNNIRWLLKKLLMNTQIVMDKHAVLHSLIKING